METAEQKKENAQQRIRSEVAAMSENPTLDNAVRLAGTLRATGRYDEIAKVMNCSPRYVGRLLGLNMTGGRP